MKQRQTVFKTVVVALVKMADSNGKINDNVFFFRLYVKMTCMYVKFMHINKKN